ncbi:MAG: hypothetical protein V9G12_23160 [Microthrixaceae bacterium]
MVLLDGDGSSIDFHRRVKLIDGDSQKPHGRQCRRPEGPRCPIGDLRIELVVLGHVSDEIQKLRAERRDPQLRAVPLGPPRLVVGEQSFSHEVLLGQEPNGVVESVIQHRLDLLQLSVAAVTMVTRGELVEVLDA